MKDGTFPHTRKPLHWWRQGLEGRKPRSHGGERSNRGAEGKAEGFLHRGLVLTSTHQPARLVCSPAGGGWGLGAEAKASVFRSQGEDWGWLREHSLKGASVPQLAGRESRKKTGPAREARDLCFGVCKARRFFPSVPAKGRALPKQAPEMSASRGYQLGPQRWA